MHRISKQLGLAALVVLACGSVPAQAQKAKGKQKLNEALLQAVQDNKYTKVGQLLAQGADPDAIDSLDTPALLYAANSGALSVAQLLLDKGAHIHKTASNGNSPLSAAVLQGNMPMVLMLMKRGGTIKEAEVGMSSCALFGHTPMLKFLLDKGAKVDATGDPQLNPSKATPLMDAALGGHLDTVQLLIDRGANINALSESKETALMGAIGADGVEPKVIGQIVKLLLAKGAKADAKTDTDPPKTALMMAREKKLPEVVKLLQEAGAKE